MHRGATTTAQSTIRKISEDVISESSPPDFGTEVAMSHLNNSLPRTKHTRRRQLGGIESMYNFYLSRGTDVLTMMARVESVYPVYEPAVRWALRQITARHPLLRCSIAYDQSLQGRQAVFVERDTLELDFLALDRCDWLDLIVEEVHKPFDNQKPLWRCRMLKAPELKLGYTHSDEAFKSISSRHRNDIVDENISETDKYNYTSVFVFISHHSIMDGGYIMWLFREFINFLDAFILDSPIGSIKELPFLPSIEDCVECPQVAQSEEHASPMNIPGCHLRFCYDSVNSSLINDYNTKFGDEIKLVSQHPPRNEILFYKFSKKTTSAFMSACARENCKPAGALTVASILAIIDLIYPTPGQQTVFEIPFEFIVDLRRHYRIDNLGDELLPYFTGVAASHISLSVNLELGRRPVMGPEFWKIARCLAKSLQDLTVNPNAVIINKMKQEYDSFTKDPEIQKQTGKSPFALCLSNMGKMDNVLHETLRERIRLTDVHGHSSTMIDHMPVFFVTTLTVNEHLEVNVSYCKSYTSAETTLAYMQHLQLYIDQPATSSKL